jgi:hypothetical protein
MLIESKMESSRDRVGTTPPAASLNTTRLASAAAANTGTFERDEVQARRLRRQRREERALRHNFGGWTARMW